MTGQVGAQSQAEPRRWTLVRRVGDKTWSIARRGVEWPSTKAVVDGKWYCDEVAPVREDRAVAADIEAAAEAICNTLAGFERWTDYATERLRQGYRQQARAALAAVFSEVEDA